MNLRETCVIAATLFAVACSKPADERQAGKPAEAPAPAVAVAPEGKAAAAGPMSRCEMKVSGDLTATVVGEKPRGALGVDMEAPMAASDFWMTDEELRSGLESMFRAVDGKKSSREQIAAEVDKLMKEKDPRFMILMLVCAGKEGSVTFNPGKGAKYANVAYGPKTYKVVEWSGSSADVMTVSGIHFGQGEGRTSFDISEPGSLEIKSFDEHGVTGTFAFKAASREGKKVQIEGSFDIGCIGQKCKK